MPLVLQLIGAIQVQLLFLCLGFFLVTFPDGRLTPRWSWLIGCTLFVQGLLFQSDLIFSWPLPLLFLEIVLAYGSPVALQIFRYRRLFTPVERQQTKLVNAGLIVAIGSLLLAILVQNFIPVTKGVGALLFLACDSVAPAAFLLIPVSITLAILRSRLWEIDTLINKALVYGSLTALLVALYAGFILGLESLAGVIGGQATQQPIVVVVSTLAIAALFHPLRTRLQALIDRRFYRKKYHAAKTLATFSAALRNEVDLQELREQLIAVVQETMQPAHVSLWLRQPERRPTDQIPPWEAHRIGLGKDHTS